MDKQRNILLFFTGIFMVGLTLGSVIGLGGTAEVELAAASARRYIAVCAVTNLPFWCCVLLPCRRGHRLGFSALALFIKGVLLGCSGVFVLSAGGPGRYLTDIFPQILSTVPLYIFTSVRNLGTEETPYTYYAILTNFCLSILADFFSSCVQYLIFFVFSTIQGFFITNL